MQTWATGDAAAAVVTDAIPLSTTLVGGSISSGGIEQNGEITWTFPVSAGASGLLTFAVQIEAGAGGAGATAPSLSIEPVSGSEVVTSSASLASQANCALGSSCAALQGVWQGANGVGPAGWNSNPAPVRLRRHRVG